MPRNRLGFHTRTGAAHDGSPAAGGQQQCRKSQRQYGIREAVRRRRERLAQGAGTAPATDDAPMIVDGSFERILAALHKAALDPADWSGAAGLIDEALGTHGPPPVSSFASFRGASAGRGRRTSGVDGADIGRGSCRFKEIYRKKGNIFWEDRPGGARRMGVQGGKDGGARRTALSAVRLFSEEPGSGTPSGFTRRRQLPPRRRRAGPPGWR